MGNFVINAKNTSDKTGTITPDIGFKYSSILNQINEAYITISGMGTVDQELIELGTEIYIYRKGILKFRGFIDNYNSLEGGAVVIHVSGFERWLTIENGTYASSPWKATASATIFTAIIGESTELNAGTIEAGTSIDFRASLTDSLWSATTNLIRKTTQDVSMDYTTSPKPEISILDHTGSATSVATLNSGIEITDPRVSFTYPLGNKIIVYGKGDGTNQITGTASDATSIAAYGTITRTVIDRSIMSASEASTLAAAELALTKDPIKIYDFDMVNPDISIVLGDHLTLNTNNLTNEEVRVVGIDRGEQQGKEYMTLQVTNPAYKQNIRNKNLVMAAINKRLQDSNAFMQGATNTNTWGGGINSKTDYALKVGFYVSPAFEDEAGNLNVNTLTVDYDVDKFKSNIGTASFTGSDPQVQNSSALTQPTIAGNTGNANPNVSGTSATQTPTALSAFSYANTDTVNGWPAVASIIGIFSGSSTYSGSNGYVYAANYTGGAVTVDLAYLWPTESVWINEGDQSISNGTVRRYAVSQIDSDYETGWFQCKDDNGVATHWWGYQINEYTHTHGTHDHGPGGYKADSHPHSSSGLTASNHDHPNGGYDINAADINHISVGDGVDEAVGVNASSVNLYLDKWNTGTSTWDNIHSVLATGKTLDNDVDISDSGTYPNSTGFWRVRAEPITATADFIQAIVRLKMHIDS